MSLKAIDQLEDRRVESEGRRDEPEGWIMKRIIKEPEIWELLKIIAGRGKLNFNVKNPLVHRGYIHFVLRVRTSKSTNHIHTRTKNIPIHLHEQSYTSYNLTRTITNTDEQERLFRVPRQTPSTEKLYINYCFLLWGCTANFTVDRSIWVKIRVKHYCFALLTNFLAGLILRYEVLYAFIIYTT